MVSPDNESNDSNQCYGEPHRQVAEYNHTL